MVAPVPTRSRAKQRNCEGERWNKLKNDVASNGISGSMEAF